MRETPHSCGKQPAPSERTQGSEPGIPTRKTEMLESKYNRRLALEHPPHVLATQNHDQLHEPPIGRPGENQILVRNHYLSIYPAIRDWMSERPSYLPSIVLGDPVRSTVIGEVIESRHPKFKPGQL